MDLKARRKLLAEQHDKIVQQIGELTAAREQLRGAVMLIDEQLAEAAKPKNRAERRRAEKASTAS